METFENTDVAHIVESSNGTLSLDKDGNVLKQETNERCAKVVKFDLAEYEDFWGKAPSFELDILDLKGILEDGRELIWTNYRDNAFNHNG